MNLSGLSNEIKVKIKKIRPKTLGQALRIDGVTPAAALILSSILNLEEKEICLILPGSLSLILRKDLNFNEKHISKLRFFARKLLEFNKSYNLIAKSTENDLWNRHILDLPN